MTAKGGRAMKYARWTAGDYNQDAAARLREAGYPELLSAVLAARGEIGRAHV